MPDALTNHRRNLHQIPEIGFELPKTKAYLLDALAGVNAEIEEVLDHGLTVFFDNGKQHALAFRTDMDALRIGELCDTPYKSRHDGCMHACGHDAHMAMMLVFADWVRRHSHELDANVLLIFQPAEESGGGAQRIVDTGTLGRHRVKSIYALHVDPQLAIGEVASRPGAFMARASEVWADVRGKAAHVARSQEGIDALWAGAELYRRLVQIERNAVTKERRLLKFGLFQSGVAQNIVSAHTRFGGTMRTFDEGDYQALKHSIQAAAADVARETGADVQVRVEEGYPPVINDPALFELAKAALSDMPFTTFAEPNFLGEDFSSYLAHAPGLMMYIGLGHVAPLHSPNFDFDERALHAGVEIYKRLCKLG